MSERWDGSIWTPDTVSNMELLEMEFDLKHNGNRRCELISEELQRIHGFDNLVVILDKAIFDEIYRDPFSDKESKEIAYLFSKSMLQVANGDSNGENLEYDLTRVINQVKPDFDSPDLRAYTALSSIMARVFLIIRTTNEPEESDVRDYVNKRIERLRRQLIRRFEWIYGVKWNGNQQSTINDIPTS